MIHEQFVVHEAKMCVRVCVYIFVYIKCIFLCIYEINKMDAGRQ